MEKERKKRDLLSIFDLNADEILTLIQRASQMKKDWQSGNYSTPFKGKSVALLFEKPSTRTRLSFEVGVWQLGGQPIFISSDTTQIQRGEPIEDTARVLSRYVSMIMIRTYAQERIEKLAEYATIPVINGLSDLSHPCQVLSDLLTVSEHKIEGDWRGNRNILLEGLRKLKFAWIGDGNNMANSWIAASGVLGLELAISCPEKFEPSKKYIEKAKKMGGKITISNDPAESIKNSDVINTDVWASMGQEKERGKRTKIFKEYQVNSKLMKLSAKNSIFMHCLPAHRGEEVTDDVIEGASSVVWDQAENRLHMQKAIMEMLIRSVEH